MKTILPSLAGAFLVASMFPAAGVLPVQNEQIVVTCFSGLYNYYGAGSVVPDPNGFVVAQFDTTSGTISPLLPTSTAPPKLWTGPAAAGYHNELNVGNEWRASRLGEVFGVTLDDASPPNIYVGASNCYNQVGVTTSLNATAPQGPGGIYRLDAISGVVSASTSLPSVPGTLPGTGPGIGNLCFRRAGSGTGFLYASNLDDGKIYRLNTGLGVVGAPFDHGVQGRPQESLPVINDDGAPGLTPIGRRIWGVKTYKDRLFYAVWWEDSRNIDATESNEVWSVDLDSNGDFIPSTARRRLTVPDYPQPGAGSWSHPVASIDFSPGGAMYLAERYWQLQPLGTFDLTFGAHFARLHRFTLSGPTWVTTPTITHEVGAYPGSTPAPASITGASCAGGVAVNCDDSIWATGDMFNGYTPTDSTTNNPVFGPYLYGAIRIPPGGNATPPLPYGRGSFIIDYDGAVIGSGTIAKLAIGAITTRRDCCMVLTAGNVQCPATPGGPYTTDLTITNLMAVPITNLQFTPCPNNQLPPGATTLTPFPAALTLGSPIPPGGTGVVSLSLPGVPPVGGKVCFVVTVVADGSEPIPLCSEKICVDLPKCPCAKLTASNKQCPPCLGDPHSLDLTIENIWNTPYSWYELVPCPPSQVLPPGAVAGIPSPGGVQPFNPAPLMPGQSQTVPVTVTGLAASGGQVCFCVRLYGALENELLCEEMICVDFPPCTPGPGMTLQPVGQILCPEYVGGPFKFTFNITNIQPAQAFGAIITPCSSGAGGGGPFGATPGTVTFAPPLGLGQTSQNITVCISGLQSGEQGCLCVQFLDANGRPFCQGEICFTLPPCEGDPPCLHLDALNVQCPAGNNGYTFGLNLTNNSGVAASWYQLCPVPPVDLPPGAVTGQPTPAGLIGIPPLQGNGGTIIIPGIQLPLSVPEGANFCYLVKIYNATEQLICEEMHCITLPRCACATVTADVTCVAPFPNRQVTFNVTNNTNVVGTPFNFTQAVIIPGTGFTPPVMTPAPNPIVPGASGTFTTVFNGYKAPQCVMLLLFNADRSKCCRVKVCPPWVSCDQGPPKDVCDLASETVSEANGLAPQVAWITNNSPTLTKNYSWTVVPAAVPGCTGTLPAGAFTPASGVTGPVGPGSMQAVAFSVNAASLAPGVCAGFQICFTELSPFNAVEPVCCPGTVRKIRPSDPCIIKNPTGRGIPPLVGDVDIIIKNPTSAVMDLDIILFDTGGNTSYAASGPPWPVDSNDMVQRLNVPPGESVPMLAAANLAVVGPGSGGVPVPVDPRLVEAIWIRLCNNAQGYEILGSEIRFQPGGVGPLPLPEPGGNLPVSQIALGNVFGTPVMQFSTWSDPGEEYEAWSSRDLLNLAPGGNRIWPKAGFRMITGPDGTFLGMDGVMHLSLPATSGAQREFFRVGSVEPVFGRP